MADQSIWKKTLGMFVEFEDDQVPQVESSDDLEAILAQSQAALANLGGDVPSSTEGKEPKQISSFVGSYVSNDEVSEAIENDKPVVEGESVDFAALYEAVCEQKVSIFQVKEILDQPELSSLPKETKAKAAAVALRAMGTSIEEVIQDAYQKDQALDTAELVKRQKAQTKKEENESKIAAIQQEVDDFLVKKNQEIDELRQSNLESDKQLHQWVNAKLEEEKNIYDIVAHFVSDEETEMTLGEVHPEPTQVASPSPATSPTQVGQ